GRFRLGQSGNERHEAGNYATYRQTVTRRPQVLFIGEWTRHRYHRAPVFFLLLTGAAEENFAKRRRCGEGPRATPVSRQPPSQPHGPLAMVAPGRRTRRRDLAWEEPPCPMT